MDFNLFRGSDKKQFANDNLNQSIDMEERKQAICNQHDFPYPSKDGFVQKKDNPLVEQTEMRAMRMRDLIAVEHVIRDRCEREGWASVYDGSPLTPRRVNLYDFNYFYILPSTVPNGVILHGLKKKSYRKGDVLIQQVSSHDMRFQKSIGEVMEDCEGTKVLVRVIWGRFTVDNTISLQTKDGITNAKGEDVDVSCGSPTFVEFKDGVRMSLKEKLHPQPTRPNWFISHTWSDSVIAFVERCDKHAHSYCTTWAPGPEPDFDEEKFYNYSYWVCAYANNQHNLATEIVGSLIKAPFMKAIGLSNGTLIMMDQDAAMLSRIWCDFEIFLTMMNSQMLDIAALDENGKPCLLTETVLPSDENAEDKAWRDKSFPAHLLKIGMTVVLEKGNASHVIDKIRILKSMVSMKNIIDNVDVDWDDEGPLKRINAQSALDDESRTYELANDALHARFAMFAWPLAHERGIVNSFIKEKEKDDTTFGKMLKKICTNAERTKIMNCLNCSEFEEEKSVILDLPAITSKAVLPDRYEITLPKTNQKSFLNVFHGIPLNCRYVRLEFHNGDDIGNEIFFILWEKLSKLKHLIHFDVKIGNLSNVHSDDIVTDPKRGLAVLLPKYRNLKTLVLDIEGDTFCHNSCLSSSSVMALKKVISSESSLTTFKFDFGGRGKECRVFQMSSSDEIFEWSLDASDAKFRIERIHNGFGNTLSSYAIHAARDSKHLPKQNMF